MSRADLSAPQATRYLIMALVALIHALLVLGLIRAFAPDFAANVTHSVLATFTVSVTPPPPPAPPPQPAPQPEKAGAAAESGKRAVPREAVQPKPKLAIATPLPAPTIAAKGPDNSSGARDAGRGAGAGGQGSGTGSGNGGNGRGGGAVTKAVKIAGEINSMRDLPDQGSEVRQGSFVNVALTVGTNGRVKGCWIFRASSDAAADRAVCQLAIARFRFRPATDRAGNPVESVFGWQQRYCGSKDDCSRTMR